VQRFIFWEPKGGRRRKEVGCFGFRFDGFLKAGIVA